MVTFTILRPASLFQLDRVVEVHHVDFLDHQRHVGILVVDLEQLVNQIPRSPLAGAAQIEDVGVGESVVADDAESRVAAEDFALLVLARINRTTHPA